MENRKLPDESALTFYSRVSASISHELKNSLAVINESAGFLEDIMLMAQKGRPLDPKQIGTLAGTILRQVQRSNTIIKNMNRLAHSLDEKRASIELTELLGLMVRLAERSAVNKGVNLLTDFPESAILLTTCPFYLETLAWMLLDFAINNCGGDKTIRLSAALSGSGAQIGLTGFEKISMDAVDDFFSGRLAPLLTILNGDLTVDENDRRLAVMLPETVSQTSKT